MLPHVPEHVSLLRYEKPGHHRVTKLKAHGPQRHCRRDLNKSNGVKGQRRVQLQRQEQRQDSVAEALEYPWEQKRATRQGYAKMMQDEAGSGWSKGSQSVTEGSSKNNARPPTASGL